ncbi:MAG: metalloregulator ArsR/SmtB family transcription factor [Pseudomonadota bacterium]
MLHIVLMNVNMFSMDDSPAEVCCPPLFAEPLTEARATQLAQLLKALADPARLRLISLIAASPNHEACACDLPQLVGRSQPTVSHHLSQLVNAGILLREKRGKWAWFRLDPDRVAELQAAIQLA